MKKANNKTPIQKSKAQKLRNNKTTQGTLSKEEAYRVIKSSSVPTTNSKFKIRAAVKAAII